MGFAEVSAGFAEVLAGFAEVSPPGDFANIHMTFSCLHGFAEVFANFAEVLANFAEVPGPTSQKLVSDF